ncbi:hypothetical protein OS493_015668 [Desmophyllum pertusum]|uniref:Uncharacterized protein n=1 Tax=Desmophyllum pertusum TaxID=174260 RepID=A0A9X0CM69_9CNID|nr:hypothetical protein OS493_015668 [Desmophyllum pertusum]
MFAASRHLAIGKLSNFSSFLTYHADLVLSVKPQSMKPSARWHDVYEIEPLRASIPAHSYVYASVTFSPPSMQTYNATLEAAVDGMPSAMSKYRNLTFDIQGEGNLPRITVIRPTARNKKGALSCCSDGFYWVALKCSRSRSKTKAH